MRMLENVQNVQNMQNVGQGSQLISKLEFFINADFRGLGFSLGPSYRMGRVYKWIWGLCVCVCLSVRHHFEDDYYFCS